MSNKLRFGVMGMSEGNGHPYSWSAIFNGFDPAAMASCPFPVIPDYLSKQSYPQDFLGELGEVTHIWTQDHSISEHVARAARIAHVVNDFQEMIGQVDAVLLARDDAENHARFATPFLEAGIPIYIDKPLAHSIHDAKVLLEQQQYEYQIFTCSALRYANEFTLTAEEREAIGEILAVNAYTPKSWEKYAIHIIEPVLQIMQFPEIAETVKIKTLGSTKVLAKTKDEVLLSFQSYNRAPHFLGFELIGTKTSRIIEFRNAFQAFKSALADFVVQINENRQVISRKQTLSVVALIEAGV